MDSVQSRDMQKLISEKKKIYNILRRGDNQLFQTLQDTVRSKHPVSFEYTSTESVNCIHMVEPVVIIYRWYAWYRLAYSTAKCDYRTYKLVHM